MKLLFDASLSPKLATRLASLFPGSSHVFTEGLECRTADITIWRYARQHGFAIVTTDSDFLVLAENEGIPPYLVRLDRCTMRTTVIEELIRRHAVGIAALETGSVGQGVLRIRALLANAS